MQCEYCGRTIKRGPVRKVIRGKRHMFCSGTCYNLWFYKVPKFDMDEMYSQVTLSIPVNRVDKVLREEA